jgi:hypothetical protein
MSHCQNADAKPWWYIPIIPATWEATVQGQPGQKVRLYLNKLTIVVHTYNPSHMGGIDSKITVPDHP